MAVSKRAICRNAECKKQSIKIDKGALRLGSWVDYGENQSWAWKHWGCVTPVQIASLKTATDGDLKMLDGYDDLPSDSQVKIGQAFEDGHVADNDWRGDPEQNRPGMKGFRSPAAKKSKKEGTNEEEPGDDNGDRSPSKPASKKRGREKRENIEDMDAGPAQKKIKAAPKKGKKDKSGEDAADMAIDAPVSATGKAVGKKGRPPKVKESQPGEVTKPTKKVAAKKKVTNSEEAAHEGITALAATMESTTAGKRGGKADEEIVATPATEAQHKKTAGRPRKAKADNVKDSIAAAAENGPAAKVSKKAGASQTAANSEKRIAMEADPDVKANLSDATIEDGLKLRKGRRRANKSS
ncbi:MAG: hypothetical protein Q9207_007683 [Kuettlingeria erythrocarpa]